MEFDTKIREQEFCTTKSWAKHKQSRKYGSSRDVHKSNPNGLTLSRLNRTYRNYRYSYCSEHENIKIECNGGINPIEKYLNISHPNCKDIESNLNDILQDTNPTTIKYQKNNGKQKWGKPTNELIVYYRYSPQQQYEQYYHNLQQTKAIKKHNKQYTKAKYLKNGKKLQKLQQKVYKPPIVEENELKYKKPEKLMDKNNKTQYIQYDLGKNKWITAFATKYEWICYHTTYSFIESYKLYIAVDYEEKDKRFFQNEDNEHKKYKKYENKKKKRYNVLNERQRRKRDRKNDKKKIKEKRIRDKLKWEYIGIFNGGLKGYFYNKSKNYNVDKVHKINYMTYYDYNDNVALKKNYSKNGKLCRWIKLIPCDGKYNFDKHVECKIFGVDVDDYSQPIIPYKILNENDINNDEYDGCDEDENDNDGDYNDYDVNEMKENNKNFQIGPNIDDIEVEEGKGCRLIIKKKRKYIAFGRKIDDPDEEIRCNSCHCYDIKKKVNAKKKAKQYAKRIGQLPKKRNVDDWDIYGTPFW